MIDTPENTKRSERMTSMKRLKQTLALFLVLLTVCGLFAVTASAAAKVDISNCAFSYTHEYTYTGKAIKPAVTVLYGSKTLKSGMDYSAAYSSNTNVGTGKITVTGKGNYTGKVTLGFKIILAAPKNLKASAVKAASAKLSWTKVTGAAKYVVYSYNSSSKKYTKLATVKTNSAALTLKAITTYKLCVKAYDKNGKASALSAKIAVTTLPATPAIAVGATGTTSVKIAWKAVAGASGYRVFTYNASTKKYTKIKTIKSAKTLQLEVTGLKAGTTYAYAVQAYAEKGGNTLYSAKSALKYIATKPDKVTGLKASGIKSSSLKLSWTKTAGATGYNVYSYSASKNEYKLLGTSTTNSYNVTGLKALTSYTFAVSAYKTSGGKTSTGAKSAKVTAKTKDANALTDFQDIIKGGKFTINYSVSTTEGTIPIKSVVSGKTTAQTMKATIDGISATMYTWYDGANKTGLVKAKAMGLGFYEEINEAKAKENGLDAASQKQLFAPAKDPNATIFEGTEKVGSTSCKTYSYLSENGVVITYYFNGTKLVQYKAGSEILTIKSYSATVDSSDIKKPSVVGCIKMEDIL